MHHRPRSLGYTFPTCAGWSPGSAAQVIAKWGFTREGCVPYTGGQKCTRYCQNNVEWTHRRSFVPYAITSVAAAKEFIRSGGAITSYMSACTDFIAINRTYPGVPYTWDGTGTCAAHQVLVIGFNDNEGWW